MKRVLLAACAAAVALASCAQTFIAAAAVVNGDEISRAELDTLVEAQLAANPTAADAATRAQLGRDVLAALIRQRLLVQLAEREGISATDEEIDEQIDQIRSGFATEEEFAERVRGAGLTPETLRERIELQVLQVKLAAELSPEPSESALREAYEQRRDSFRQLQVKHILFAPAGENLAPARRRAERARTALDSGAQSFARLARQSDDPSSAEAGGVLADGNGKRPGWIPFDVLATAFADAAWNAPIGQVVGPVRTQFGFHLIVTLKKRTRPFEAVRQELVESLRGATGDGELQQRISEAGERATILVNPRYGEWEAESQSIVPHESYVPAEPDSVAPDAGDLPPGFDTGG